MDYKIFNFVVDIIFIILALCLIFGRWQIARVFKKAVATYKIPYNRLQEQILMIIIWVIGIMFIVGSVVHILKIFSL